MGIEIDDSNKLAIFSGSCSDLIADFRSRNDEKGVDDDDDDVVMNRIGVWWVVENLVILEMYAVIAIFCEV